MGREHHWRYHAQHAWLGLAARQCADQYSLRCRSAGVATFSIGAIFAEFLARALGATDAVLRAHAAAQPNADEVFAALIAAQPPEFKQARAERPLHSCRARIINRVNR
jgi:hypothetical protein